MNGGIEQVNKTIILQKMLITLFFYGNLIYIVCNGIGNIKSLFFHSLYPKLLIKNI